MSFGVVSITPYIKDYGSVNNPNKSQESSLATYGYLRTPGTSRPFIPYREATGKYRTGLDEKAAYLDKLPKEDRAIEVNRIKAMKESLESSFKDVDFSPNSKIWNVWGNEPFQASKINASNAPIYLYPDKSAQDLLNYAWVRVSPVIAKSKLAIENGECPDCQYYLSDEQAETQSTFSKKEAVNKATASLQKLKDTPIKLRQVARLMGLPVNDNDSAERCYNLLDDTLKESLINRATTGKGVISLFNEICELSKETLNVKDLVEKSIRHNIYRLQGDKIMEGTVTVHDSKDDFVNHLLKPENQKELLSLQARVKNKESINE